jgi:LPXTG-motif cell wall-anchored protein
MEWKGTLKNGEIVKFENIPDGTEYTIKEEPYANYKQNLAENSAALTGEIGKVFGETALYDFTVNVNNVYSKVTESVIRPIYPIEPDTAATEADTPEDGDKNGEDQKEPTTPESTVSAPAASENAETEAGEDNEYEYEYEYENKDEEIKEAEEIKDEDEGYIPPATEPAVNEPAAEPETPAQAAEAPPVNAPERVRIGEIEYYEEMPADAIPLANGWYAVELTDDLYEIFDGGGVPLGFITFEGRIEDWKEFEDLITLADFLLPKAPVAPEFARVPSPKTGASPYIILGLLGIFTSAAAGAVIYKKNKLLNAA